MKKLKIQNYTGCLLGGAIGDALGAPIEFHGLDEIRSEFGKNGVTDYVEFNNGKGKFTDDTQMTLFTAEAFLRAYHRLVLRGIGGIPDEIAYGSYLRWLKTQGLEPRKETSDTIYFDTKGWLMKQKILYEDRAPGKTTINALFNGIKGTIDKPINDSKGCGTVMRIAPVGLMLEGNNKLAFQTGCKIAAMTHGHPTGYLSAGFLASVISDLAVGKKLLKAIENAKELLISWKNNDETMTAVNRAVDLFYNVKTNNSPVSAELIELLGSGWIAEEALSISLFASLIFENDFKNGIIFAVNHSGDSDSTGAITGNILGLINGEEKIPQKWITNLIGNEIVKQVGEDLYIKAPNNIYENLDWDEKYPPL